MGHSTDASGLNSIAMGFQSIAAGNNSTAIGDQTIASESNSTAIGNSTNASGQVALPWDILQMLLVIVALLWSFYKCFWSE